MLENSISPSSIAALACPGSDEPVAEIVQSSEPIHQPLPPIPPSSISPMSRVVDETLTLIRFRLGLAAANAWWRQIDGSARLRWERIEDERFERARNLFFQYREKDLSFTDCTSVALMRELKLTTVITTDRHFLQVGFEVLPSLRPRRARKPRRS